MIKAVEFEHQKEDPFGFDNIAEKVALKFLDFSGSIRKPIYLLFVAYVNELIKRGEFKTKLRNNDIRLRLEKLLVYAWKRRGNLRNKSIIGSSIIDSNPFEGNDGNWVKQNCFRIYESSSKKFELNVLLDFYIKRKMQKAEITLLNEFLCKSGRLKNNENYLHYLINKFDSKSLFSGNSTLHVSLKKRFEKSLSKIIFEGDFKKDSNFQKQLFINADKAEKEINKVLKSDKYPFAAYNNWVSTYINAVDTEIEGKNSNLLWNKTDLLFSKLDTRNYYSSLQLRRIKPKCWFKYENNKYSIADAFDQDGWDAMVRRANKKNGNFYDFKLTALKSLITETL